MMNRYRVRDATLEDVDEIARMRLSLQNHLHNSNPHLWRLSQKKISEMAEFYREKIEELDSELVVIEDIENGNLVGFGLGMISEHNEFIPERSGRIDDIWVEPPHRRKGLCKKTVSKLLHFFKAKDIESLVLNYVEGNVEAQAVWRRLGFRTVLRTATATPTEVNQSLGDDDR